MSTEYEIKEDGLFDGNAKKDAKRKKKTYCQFCGNETNLKKIGNRLFCIKCHCRMPWTVRDADDRPVKEVLK